MMGQWGSCKLSNLKQRLSYPKRKWDSAGTRLGQVENFTLSHGCPTAVPHQNGTPKALYPMDKSTTVPLSHVFPDPLRPPMPSYYKVLVKL